MVLRAVSHRFQISSRRSRCRRTCERILREHSRRIWKLSRKPFWSKSASWEIKMCEKELAVRSRSSNWGTSARWDCEIKLADFRKITRSANWRESARRSCEIGLAEIRRIIRSSNWGDSARRWCEFNIADFWEISRSPNWRGFARKLCEKRSSRKKICEMELREHTRSFPWHTFQDKIFWENIWPLDNLRDYSARTCSQMSKRSRGFDMSAAQREEARPCQPISSLVFTSLLILNI